jgi:uncharacterized protein DUF4232
MKSSAITVRRAALALTLAAAAVLSATAATAAARHPAATMSADAVSATAVPACSGTQLRAWMSNQGDGAMGSVYYQLEISNVSTTTCSLFGYPGVSAVNASGQQLGSPAARDTSRISKTVVLSPGDTAHAVLRIIDVGAIGCPSAKATGLRVFAPNTTASQTVPFSFLACANKGPVFMYVRTTRPRAGIPYYSQ